MERIQRALDLAKSQRAPAVAPAPTPAPAPAAVDDPRYEREVLNREFSISTVEFASRVSLDWPTLRERRIISPADSQSAGHAYRMLRTQVLQRARSNSLNTIGIVSAVNGEGKTLTAINLALSLAAEPNQTVMLVDLDLRRPAVGGTLGLNVERGLETWFEDDQPIKSFSYGIEGVERLFVLPTLRPLAGSSELLANVGTRRLMNELKARDPGRLLIVDLPPVLLSDDALVVAPLLDAVVLVVNERRTRREDVVRAIELLGNTRIVGTVLNRSSESELRAY